MVNLPGYLLRHAITVEPYLGASATGPVYGPAVTVRCYIEPARQTARGGNGRTVDDASTAYCRLDAAAVLTPEARVTHAGRVVEVVAVKRRDFGPPTPNHLEVTFV